MTFRSAIFDKRVRISSWMPSAKYALALSSLRFSKGSTAMLFSGIAANSLVTGLPGAGALVIDGDARLKKIKELTTRAIVDTSNAPISVNLGPRGALIG